jgi:hypothetical protein
LTTNIAVNIVPPGNGFANLNPRRISFRTVCLRPESLGGHDALEAAESFEIVLSPALDLAVEEPRFRVRAHGGDEREFCIMCLIDMRKSDNRIVIKFFEVFFTASHLDCRA